MTPVSLLGAEGVQNRFWLPGATVRCLPNDLAYNVFQYPESGKDMRKDATVNDAVVFKAINGKGGGGGGDVPMMEVHRQQLVGECLSGGAPQGFSVRVIMYPGPTLSANFDTPPQPGTEAFRWDVDIARPTAASALATTGGVQIILSDGKDSAGDRSQFMNPTDATAPPGYAVVGDGATGYRLNVRAVEGAALSVDTAIVWPVAVDRFARVSFRLLAATATANMQARILVNGTQIFAQDLGDALAPVPAGAAGFRNLWRFCAQGSLEPTDPVFLIGSTVGWWGDPAIFTGA